MSEQHPDLSVTKASTYLPVSTEYLMDMGVIPDTRPPVHYPLRTRIRWAVARRVRRLRLRLGEWVAGERFDEEVWW